MGDANLGDSISVNGMILGLGLKMVKLIGVKGPV